VILVSVMVTAAAPGVIAFSVGAKFTSPKFVQVTSWQTLVVLKLGSMVPIVSDAETSCEVQNSIQAVATGSNNFFIDIVYHHKDNSHIDTCRYVGEKML
jgi:hypothetical protein